MGVTNVIVTNFDGVFRFVVLTENNYCFFVADLIASVWQMLLPLFDCVINWLMLLPMICGRCCCQ